MGAIIRPGIHLSYKDEEDVYTDAQFAEDFDNFMMNGLNQSHHNQPEKKIIVANNQPSKSKSTLDGNVATILPSSKSLMSEKRPQLTRQSMMPMYDYNTSNRSFIKVHEQLKILGVKNNEFFLLLLNPLLQGVNPHDPNITPEQALMVITECQYNFFYFLREVVRIPQQGAGIVPFELDRGTLAAAYCFINDINLYMIKPRQTGKSVGICAFLAWAFKFGITNGGFAFFANKEKNSKANLKRMKTYLQLLPPYMANMGTQVRDSAGKLIKKTNNITRYYEPVSGNTADVMRCAISEETAEELGRGESHNFEFFDESEFTTCIETTVQVSGMAFNTASYNAIKNGMHSCRIFATTPGNLSNEKKCGSAMKIVEDSVSWDEKYYDVRPIEFKKYIMSHSNYRIVYIQYYYTELGLGEAWFRRACSNVGNNLSKIRSEILLERFAGNSESPFSEEDINELVDNIKHPIKIISFGPNGFYKIKFYIEPEKISPTRVYFLGLDPSDGIGEDNYAITVVDPYSMNTIMEFSNSYMTPQGCKELIDYIISKWIPRAIICVERNRNGLTLIDYLKESRLKSRIYTSSEASMETILARDKYDDIGFLKDEIMKRKYSGVNTTTTTRKMMMNILVNAVRFKKSIVSSENLVEDIKNLVLKNGNIQAAPKKHDDCVMSWCMAMYTIQFGEKLERYGFKRNEIPADVIVDTTLQSLNELFSLDYIREMFPSMTSFYDNEVRNRLEKEYEEKKSQTMQEVVDRDIGSITKDLIDMDPEYGKTKVQSVMSSNEQRSSADLLRSKWQRLNAGVSNQPNNNQPNNRCRRRISENDDRSWI